MCYKSVLQYLCFVVVKTTTYNYITTLNLSIPLHCDTKIQAGLPQGTAKPRQCCFNSRSVTTTSDSRSVTTTSDRPEKNFAKILSITHESKIAQKILKKKSTRD